MAKFKDLTLREGAQVPGLQISTAAGKDVLDRLADLEIDCVEVSFPRAHPREEWFRHGDDLGIRTTALARSIPRDVDAALEVEPNEIEVIITSSDVQLEYALGKSREEATEMLISNVERALDGGVDAGVTLMDAMRADRKFLADTARTVVDVGAKHVTLADTTGSGTPKMVSETVAAVVESVGDDADVAVHTHDDKGVATANAAAGVKAGATAIDATVGGIGERAGNAPLEEVAVFLAERGDELTLDLEDIVPVCRQVHELLGVDIPPGKPILGERAYRHESGMHTAAMLEDPRSYEAFDPGKYGGQRALLFGEDTGRGAVRSILKDIGIDITDEVVAENLSRLANAAEQKGDPLTQTEARTVLEVSE